MAPAKSSAASWSRTPGSAWSTAAARAFSSGSRRQAEVDLAVVAFARVLLLLGLEDVHRAAVAGQQVRPIVRAQEAVQRLDAGHDPHQVVVTEDEHRVDQVVALALVAQQHLQPVGEEGEERLRGSFAGPINGPA